jgi:peptide/nickel transport system substrate-binding protein
VTACGQVGEAPEEGAAPAVEEEAVPAEEEAAPAEEEAAGKVITITYLEEPNNLNPLYTDMWFSWITWDLFLPGLWNIDENGEFVPELAAEFPTMENGLVSEDGLVITIPLREDLVWSDGTPLTSADFVFTYEMRMSDANTVLSRYPYDTYVESITAPDEHTIQITLNDTYVDWATAFFVRDNRVLPMHILQPVFESEGTLDNAEWNRNPTVGCGPFVIREWVAGSHLILDANDNYWRGRPNLDEIDIRIVPDRAAQLAALDAGDSDIGTYILGSDAPTIEGMGDVVLQTAFAGWSQVIFLNLDPATAHPAMTDARVREAIELAIDRQLLIDTLFYGLYEIPATYWHGTIFDNPDIEPRPYDPDEARALLESAGWVDENGDGIREQNGVDLTLRYSAASGSEVIEANSVALQQMLADVGINMEINNMTTDLLWSTYADGGPIATGQYDMAQWSDGMWYFPSPDTSYFLCDQIPTDENPDGYNWYGICDPEMDQLFQDQAVTADMDARVEMFHRIGQIMHDQTMIILMRTDTDIWAVNTRLTNVRFSGASPLMYAYEWDVTE